jgi:ATP-binding cassette subfamily F protein 3
MAFDGTIVAVSHDRYFINRIATRIIELAPERDNGMIDYPLESYDDAFTEYMRIRESRNLMRESAKKSVAPTDSKAEFEAQKREKAKARSEQKQRERAEKKIGELESELETLEAELFGEAATDYVRAAEIESRKAEIEEELLSLYEIVM